MKKDTETSLSIPEWQMSEAWVKWFLSYILPQNIGKKKNCSEFVKMYLNPCKQAETRTVSHMAKVK